MNILTSGATPYLRHRRNMRLRSNLIAFAWFLTRLTIWASSALMVGYMAFLALTILRPIL